jgi:integrase
MAQAKRAPQKGEMMAQEKTTRKRRGYGEGSIHQRPDGTWRATISAGYNANGKRKRRDVYGKTKREVQDELTKLQNAKAHGTLTKPSRTTVGQFMQQWLNDVARVSVKATTYANYQGVVKNHITKHIGGIPLQRLEPHHVQAMYSTMEQEKASSETRRLVHVVLSRGVKQALKWGLVVRNVCCAIDPPRVVKSDITPLNPGQVGKLLAAAKDARLEAIYMVAIGIGLRLGELFGLQWSDVDLDASTLAVRHTLTEVGGKLTLTEPKTAKGRRLVTLPRRVVDALVDHRKRMVASGFAGVPFVFCNSRGGPLRRSHFHRNEFKPLLKRAELPAIRFHDLRHTSATLLLAQGVHPKVVQERLGHAQISLTLDTYSHVLPSMQADAASRLDSLLVPIPAVENGGKMAVNVG